MLKPKGLVLAQHTEIIDHLTNIHNRMHRLHTINILQRKTGHKATRKIILHLKQIPKLINQMYNILLIFKGLSGKGAENALDVLVHQSLPQRELNVDELLFGLVFGGLVDQLAKAQAVLVEDEEGRGG